jgi:hypothetical protein
VRVSTKAEACAYDTGSLGCRPLAVSSNERVRGLWLVTRNKITGGPPLLIYLAESLLQGGSHNKKRNSLPQSNLRASQRANPLSHACGQELSAELSHETEKRRGHLGASLRTFTLCQRSALGADAGRGTGVGTILES